ncbi:GNAT family N-acetyltransferase [Sinomicrobium soli]|uniref:GNAT family N-acetyltransferase n=1 Tax=Sinomicrobium sp. N-1-3-6 TaxID=2219864 RepID=UPI000DCB7C69|nr:GNAT family N-acetyltransferase [Sinomicrobium sp. N-1-3-6]RAV28027.1 GNAT family N-acetyltransferase [Sinomicrobium sp. N-1-3-6]
MKIRKVEKTDNRALAGLIKNVFEEYNAPKEGTVYSDPVTNRLYDLFEKEREKSVLWVAEDDGEIAGCCGVYPTEGLPAGCAELVKFYIADRARGKGLGKKFMELNIRSAIRFGYKELYLESLPAFSDAVAWYEKLGFRKLDNRLGNSGHPSCNIWMLKKLP